MNTRPPAWEADVLPVWTNSASQNWGFLSKNDNSITEFSNSITKNRNYLADVQKDPNFKKWLYDNKHPLYAKSIWNKSGQAVELIFTDRFVIQPNDRIKQEQLRVMGNLCRFHDIKYDSNLHQEFTLWLKKKEIKWGGNKRINMYRLAKQMSLNEVISSIRKFPEKYKTFSLFVLVSGLRTEEAITVYNNHDKICQNNLMEIFWDRNTKKTNAIFCHPLLHSIISGSVNKSGIKKNMKASILGCELRYLRKLNYTQNATKIDGHLAEFMQGRTGNISQRHYFLPLMENNRRKWNQIWKKIIVKCLE